MFKEHTRIYRSISSLSTPSSFQLQVLLCVPELTATQILAYLSPDSSRLPIDPTPRYILLESWAIDFLPSNTAGGGGGGRGGQDDRSDVAPPTMYKHSISLFRSVYTLLRILPAWKLARRARRPGGTRNGNFTIQIRVESDEGGSGGSRIRDTLSFGKHPLHVVFATCDVLPSSHFADPCYFICIHHLYPIIPPSRIACAEHAFATEDRWLPCCAASQRESRAVRDVPDLARLQGLRQRVAPVLAVPLAGRRTRIHTYAPQESATRLARQFSWKPPHAYLSPALATVVCG